MGPWLAVAAAAAVSGLGWQARFLSRSGALAAWLVGAAVLLGAGWPGGAVLLAFFVPSSLVSRWCADPAAVSLGEKGSCRDAWQVVANGGVAAIGALAGLANPGLGLWLLTGVFAAASADTWATAWGSGSAAAPRMIVTGEVVPPGTSGGITVRGTLGGLGGAALVAATGALVGAGTSLFAAALLIGFLGMLADSVLGARWQGKWHCPRCDAPTERAVHRCGALAEHRRGWARLSNDGVNLATCALAGAASWITWTWIGPAH
jgi:uncharacterized protein (TIGR00297 family)